jgi:hypothetical protein
MLTQPQFWEIKQNHYDTVLFFQKGCVSIFWNISFCAN